MLLGDATGAVKRRSVRRSAKTARTLPANEMLEERYAVSVATRKRLNLCVWHDCCISKNRQILPPGSTDLATDAERAVTRSCRLLLQRYPFQGDARVSQTLMADWRLCWKVILTWQLQRRWRFIKTLAAGGATSVAKPVAGYADNCPAIVRLLGDMSPSYDAPPGTVWQSVIGTRYPVWPCSMASGRTTTTERLATSCGSLQAYQVEDYATALAAWQKISLTT